MIRKIKNLKNVFSFTLGSIFIIIILIIASATFYTTSRIVEKNSIDLNMSKLEIFKTSTESLFSNIKRISNQISMIGYLKEYSNTKEPLSKNNIMFTYSLLKSLPDYSITYNYISNYQIFFRDNDTVIGPNYFSYMKYYHKRNYSNMFENYEQWKDYLFARENVSYEIRNDNNINILSAYTIIKDSYNRNYAVLKVDIKVNDIYKQMKDFISDEDGYTDGLLVVSDYKNYILLYAGNKSLLEKVNQNQQYNKFFVDNKKYFSIIIKDKNGYNYIYIQSKKIFKKNASPIISIFIIIFLCIGFVFICIGIYSYTYYKSRLIEIIKKAEGHIKLKNSLKMGLFYTIDRIIQGLVNDNSELNQYIIKEKEIIKSMFYYKLLNGDFYDERELIDNMKLTGVNIEGSLFCVGTINIKHYNYLNLQYISLNKVLIENAVNNLIIGNLNVNINYNERTTVLIFSSKTNDSAEFRNNILLYIEKLKDNLSNNKNNFYFCIGGIYSNIIDLRQSYSEAITISMKYKNNSEIKNDILFYWKEKQDRDYYCSFTDALRNQIYSYTVNGNSEELVKTLTKIYRENIYKYLPSYMITTLIYSILNLLIKITYENLSLTEIEKLSFIKELKKVETYSNVHKMEYSLNAFKELSEYFHSKNQKKEKKLIEDIINYINNNFTNPDISLTSIADKFGISKVYLSKLMKDNNIFYKEYLENCRMKKAIYWLLNSKKSIKEIAFLVGYTSSNSFCRAFRRVNGISPNEYRIQYKNAK